MSALTELAGQISNEIGLEAKPTPGRSFLTAEQRLQQKLEPGVPFFDTIHHECRWRINWCTAQLHAPLVSGAQSEHKYAIGELHRWLRIAIMLGYSYSPSSATLSRDDIAGSSIRLDATGVQVLFKVMARISLQPKQKTKQEVPTVAYRGIDNSGRVLDIRASTLSEMIATFSETDKRLNVDEKKRMVSMLKSVRAYNNTRLGIRINIYKDDTILLQCIRGPIFYEVLINKVDAEQALEVA